MSFEGEEPARGLSAFKPPRVIDNGHILIQDGKIQEVGKNIRLPAACEIKDFGDVALLPALVNAHAHLQFSWLSGKTLWRRGFAPWLASMLPQLFPAISEGFATPERLAALNDACASLAGSYVGDIGGSLLGALSAVDAIAKRHDVAISHFCENFGFVPANSVWPERCGAELDATPDLASACAPCGHALYSTSPETMRQAHSFCKKHGKIFTFHLAESPEETEFLLTGKGYLAELYRDKVLPDSYRAPGLRPFAQAKKLGLLGPDTLAVHCVHLNDEEISALAASGASVCLCPRSNYNLSTGSPNARKMLEAGVAPCLGSDGLTSVQTLDIRDDAFFLRDTQDIPIFALWRMATINGATALKLANYGLARGRAAKFSVWPLESA